MKALALFTRSRQPVVYEVRLEVDTGIVSDFDDWLLLHAREMLAFPGFQAATVYRGRDLTEHHRAVRVVAYELRTRRELDSYLHAHAARMRAEGVQRFGRQFDASRRIVEAPDYRAPDDVAPLYDANAISGGLPVCANCLQPVPGRFCAQCGQEDRTFVLSLSELLYDFFGDLFNFDSRFFRTLRPLLLKPGFLTAEYLRGRRQQYLPPVRMYIFVSLIFFFLMATLTDISFGDDVNASLSRERGGLHVEGLEELTPEQRAEVEARMRETENTLGLPEGTLKLPEPPAAESDGNADDAAAAPAGTPPETADAASGSAPPAGAEAGDDARGSRRGGGFHLNTGPGQITFKDGEIDASGFGSEEINERLERGAEVLKRDPKAFAQAVLQQVPSMMFLFLPLLALVFKLLYIGSSRYYVEHLIFTLHFHSAVFVLLLLWLLFGEMVELWPRLETVSGWVTAAVWIYLPYYLYRSLRTVYAQGRFVTILKFMFLLFAYFISAVMMFVITLLYTLYINA